MSSPPPHDWRPWFTLQFISRFDPAWILVFGRVQIVESDLSLQIRPQELPVKVMTNEPFWYHFITHYQFGCSP